MTGGKKHKRGARGSTEDDPNICKRANMAASEDMQDKESTTEEPPIIDIENTATETSLEELKELLVDIQINIANIFRENKSIRTELAELTTTVREQKLEIAQLKNSLTKITKQCSDTEHELAAVRKRVNEQQDEMKYMSFMSYRIGWSNIRGKILSKYMECQRAPTALQRR